MQLVTNKLETDQLYIAEKTSNDAFITGVISGVETSLNSFKGMTDAEKSTFLTSLGMVQGEALFSENEFKAILKWLRSNNNHFGKSAFLALKEMLGADANVDLQILP